MSESPSEADRDLASGLRTIMELAAEAEAEGKHLYLVISPDEPDNGIPCWIGELCDHLYPTCPGLARGLNGRKPIQAIGLVDPEGGDICGWCLRVWRARTTKEGS